MSKVPAPANICLRISTRAAQICAEKFKGAGWSEKSIQAITPLAQEGRAGIRTTQKYIMHQEKGIRPFLMTWVQDRTLPMACKQGDGPHFRRGSHVGEPGFVDIPHVGRVWREQRWRHPGLQPKNFMRDSLHQAIQEFRPEIRKQMMDSILGKKKMS